ncbi:MAG: O-antigen ligase family protein [Sedimentisphaerales bacterium]
MQQYRVAPDKRDAKARKGTQLCDISQTRPLGLARGGPELGRRKGSSFDIIIESLLIGLLAFMPLAFGVVHAWSEEVVIVLSGAIAICFVLKLLCYRDQDIIWTWAYVPLAVFLLIPIFQLISLPRSAVEIISPYTAALRAELLGDLSNSQTLLQSMTLSFYPYATRHDLRLVLAVAAVFVVVLNVYRRPSQIKRLLMAITLIGGTVALITLGQNLFGNGKIYWFVPTRYGGGLSGPFVNHNNYGQFMNLSVGAALAVLLVKVHEAFAGKKITPTIISDYFSSHSTKSLWLLIAAVGLCIATVFVSLTRGGMVSFLIAMTFIVLVLAWQKSLKGRGWIMAIIALMAFIFVLYVSFDAVYERLASLRNFHEAQGSRLQILSDIFIAFRRFPMLGTGLGTHLVVYPMFDRSTETALAAYAENEYAQALEETGLIGLAILIIFGIIIWVNFGRCIRSSRPAICSASYGLGFGLLAILIHSLSDFGQHLPANAILSAIFCALLVSLARLGHHKNRKIKITTVSRKAICSITFVGICSLWIGNVIAADKARVAEAHWQEARNIEDFIRKNGQATEAEYADLISHASIAADYEPDNIKYRHWLNVYRWRCLSQTIDISTGDITIADDLMPTVSDIVEGFHKARTICPTYGPTYSLVGQIEKFILHKDVGAERIRKGFRLAPCHRTACFVAGYLDVLQGRYEEAIKKLSRAVQLDGRLFDDVVNIYINQLSRPHLAISAAGDDIGRLQYVTNVLEDMNYIDLAEQSRQRVKELLIARSLQDDAPAWVFVSLADIYKKQQDNEAAIECLRRALALDYGQVGWRLKLARLLMEMGKAGQAMRQARICLQLRPQSKAAQMLVADLSVHPAVFDAEKKVP